MKARWIFNECSRLMACAIILLACVTVWGQNGSYVGHYEAKAKGPDGDVVIKLELIDDKGNLSGQITSPHGVYKIVKAQVADGVLTLQAENAASKGKLVLRSTNDTLSGDLTVDGKSGPVEFKRVVLDQISGDWDGVADAEGQAFPFTLSLKLDGEKVTGSSSSQLGTSSISTGLWKDGKLSIVLEGGSGQIVLVATMVEGKLAGDYDFAGQTSGKWVAMRKK